MHLTAIQLIRIENALKVDLDNRLNSEHSDAYSREILLNRDILALINQELSFRMEPKPASDELVIW